MIEDLIYDAALCPEAFAELPLALAQAAGGRSCMLHWEGNDGQKGVLAHSRYYSDDIMAIYAQNYAADDPWAKAAGELFRPNMFWRASEFVTSEAFHSSRFHEEFVRGMGDDTGHCMGGWMITPHGKGLIGIQRSDSQSDFDSGNLDTLRAMAVPLQRMLAFHSRLSLANQWEQAFLLMPQASFVVEASGRIRLSNHAGEMLLESGGLLVLRQGKLMPAIPELRDLFAARLFSAAQPARSIADSCVLTDRSGAVWIVDFMPLLTGRLAGCALLTVECRNRKAAAHVVAERLRQRFNLTPAEAAIAIALADGLRPEDIADVRKTTRETLRGQIKSILGKMSVRRQGEIMTCVLRLS